MNSETPDQDALINQDDENKQIPPLLACHQKNIFPHIASYPTLSTAKAVKRAKELTRAEKVDVTIYSEEKKFPS